MKRKRTRREKTGKAAMSSAVLLSMLVHAALFLLATVLVVFTVVKREPPQFEPPKAVERPKMRLKKPKARVKRSSRPRSPARIMSKKPTAMPAIDLPDMGGMGGGLGDSFGDDAFDMLPDLNENSVFGEGLTTGNDFVGTLYHLRRNRQGGLAIMEKETFKAELGKYYRSGWKEWAVSKYYRYPTKLYATHFFIPPIVAPMVGDAYGDPHMEAYEFFAVYEGDLIYPEDITFRFWGNGAGFMAVRVNGKTVLTDGNGSVRRYWDPVWQTRSADSFKYQVGSGTATVGDWITLKGGEPVNMQVLFGTHVGNIIFLQLLVEVEGEEYPESYYGGPLLPIFKTQMLSEDQLDDIRRYMPDEEVDLTSTLVFNDFSAGTADPEEEIATQPDPGTLAMENEQEVPEPEVSAMRSWTFADGRQITAELVTRIGRKVSLEDSRGKVSTIPIDQFSEMDREYVKIMRPPSLDLNFKKKSRARIWAPDAKAEKNPARGIYHDWTLQIRQVSTTLYDKELVAEFFVIGEEATGRNKILLDYQQAAFVLTEENDRRFEIPGKRTQLVTFDMNNQVRGSEYDGYVVVVTDIRGEIIASKASNNAYLENVDNLRKLRVGNYFDKTFTRCSPTRPKHFR